MIKIKNGSNWQKYNDGLMIAVPAEFDFKTNQEYLQRDKNECMYEIEDDKINRVIATGNDRTLVQLSTTDEGYLFVRFLSGAYPESKCKQEAIVHYIRDWFDLDTNLVPFYELAQNDSLLSRTMKDFYGLRIIGIPDLFEAVCWAILGQQINLKFAYTLKRQFVEKFGDAIEYKGKSYWIFPCHEKISQLSLEDMMDIKMTVRKSEYIIEIAQRMTKGNLSKETLLKLADYRKIEQELIKIRGIGPWTANYVLMRCLRYPNAFPIDDVGLMNAIKLLKEMDRKPTKKEIIDIAKPWKNWEAYATFYLWRVLY